MGGSLGRLRSRRTAVAVVATVVLLAGCGGGGSPTPSLAQSTLPNPAAQGGVAPTPAPTTSYLLPVAAGQTLIVTNGNMGTYDHAPGSQGQYAFDFSTAGDMPFTVTAARAGTVVGVQDGSTIQCSGLNTLLDGTPYPNCWAQANYVLIDHGDRSAGLYMHLAPNSVLVHVGDQVCRGQPLATDGQTGWATATHLHFQVEPTPAARSGVGWWWGNSEPITFSDLDVIRQVADGVPVTKGSYVSANSESAGCATTGPSTPAPTPTPTPKPTPKPTPTVAPQEPTGVTATYTGEAPCPPPTPQIQGFPGTGCSSLIISWKAANPAVEGFRIYRGHSHPTGQGANNTCIGSPQNLATTVTGESQSVELVAMSPSISVGGGMDCYWVAAFNAGGESARVLANVRFAASGP